jgi:hypothetical protein
MLMVGLYPVPGDDNIPFYEAVIAHLLYNPDPVAADAGRMEKLKARC